MQPALLFRLDEVDPGFLVVEIDQRGLPLFANVLDGAGAQGQAAHRRIEAVDGLGQAVVVAIAQQDGGAGDVQRPGDTFGDGLEQRPRLGELAGFLAQLDQDAVGAVGFAKEDAVDPVGHAGRERPLQPDGENAGADDQKLIDRSACSRGRRGRPGRPRQPSDENCRIPTPRRASAYCRPRRMATLRFMARCTTIDVGQGQRKDGKQDKRDEDGPLRNADEHVAARMSCDTGPEER